LRAGRVPFPRDILFASLSDEYRLGLDSENGFWTPNTVKSCLKLGFVKNSVGKGLDLSDDVHVLESKGLAF